MNKRAAPLRKIVSVLRCADDAYGTQRVRLECGHEASASAGAVYRARCIKCTPPKYPPNVDAS